MRPPPQLCLTSKKMLRLLRPIYGLADTGDHWYHSLEIFLREDLGSNIVPGDASLHVWKDHGKKDPAGLIATYVEETLSKGPQGFESTSGRI